MGIPQIRAGSIQFLKLLDSLLMETFLFLRDSIGVPNKHQVFVRLINII
jgi:hypothetical protein